MDSKKAAVIIPFHKEQLSANEAIALKQCFKVLAAYPIIAVKPAKLRLPAEVSAYPFAEIVSFDNEYFESIQGYNRLMQDAGFYKRFWDHEYILIHQLDAFVFKDELDYWCSQHFDYIGAPWIKPRKQGIFKSALNKFQYYFHTRFDVQQGGLPSKKQREYKVGNGGFSLRRTRIFYDICLSHKEKIGQYNSSEHHLFNEDIFWSVEVNRKRRILNIPAYKTGLKFAFEFFPARALELNNQQLPFGCHAWDLTMDFWRPVFEQYGYII